MVAPPSIHPNGRAYTWQQAPNGALPSLHPDILKLVTAKVTSGDIRTRFDTAHALAGVPEGQRDETIFKLACKLRSADVPQEMAETLILEAARKCQPAFSETIALEKVAHAYSRYSANGESENSFPHLREKTVRNKFQLVTWRDFLEAVPQERDYRIEGLLPTSGLAVLGGRGKHGKSTLAIHTGRAIGSGHLFLGHSSKRAPVVYVNYEMPDDYFQALLRAGECPGGTYLVSRPEPILQLATVKEIIERIKSPAGVLVIDSFRGAFKLQGDAENAAGGAGVILRELQELAVKAGWLILVIHHSNRGSKGGTDSISGTSDWIAAPDVIWTWHRPDPEKNGTLTVEGRLPPIEPLAVKMTLNECICVGSVKESNEQNDNESILSVLTEEGQTADLIAQASGLPPGTVRVRLEAMFKAGGITREGGGKRGSPFLWSKINSAGNVSYTAETNSNGWEDLENGAA